MKAKTTIEKKAKSLKISYDVHKNFKILSASNGQEINRLADRVLAKFVRDCQQKPTLVSLLEVDLIEDN